MVRWMLIGWALATLLALAWVLQDAVIYFPRARVAWWGALALVLGPFAVPLYLSERMTRRAEMNKMGHGKAAFPVPEGRRPIRSEGMRGFDHALPRGSGVFLFVQEGVDKEQSAEIPAEGTLVIRRGTPGEKSHAGVLVLHDDAVSRQEHCRVSLHGRRLTLEDRSRWGTTVDGTRIQNGVAELIDESNIRIGKTVIVVRRTLA